MKTLNIRHVLLVAALVSSLPAWSQAPATLQQLLETALKSNQNIELSHYEAENGEQQIVQTRSKSLPQINASGNVTDNFKRQVMVIPAGGLGGDESEGPTKIVAGTTYSSSIGVDVSQPLFDMAAFTGLKAARAGREYYALNIKQTEEEVINQVARAYYQVMSSQETVKLHDNNIANLTKLIAAAEGQFENGLVRKIDLDRIRVNLINAQSQRTQALNQVAVQLHQLKVAMGIPLQTPLALAEISQAEIEQRIAETHTGTFDLNNRTEIKLLDAQIHLSQLQKTATRAEHYPRLSAFFNYSHNIMSNNFSETFTARNNAVAYGVGAFGVRLQIPLFDGFARQSRVAQNSIQIKQLQKQKEATSLSLDASYENARVQMSSALSTLSSQKQNVTLAEDVYNASQTNYNLGLASLTDLLDAQTSYMEAQNIYTRSLLDYKLAELEALRSEGTLRKLLE